jgi:AhpD family alkylhydroperoxidase
MKTRFEFVTVSPEHYRALLALSREVGTSSVKPLYKELIKVRASQINECAYCIDMHTRQARELGESEHRLYALNAWRDSHMFSDEEKAILALTEEVTLIQNHGVSDEVYAQVSKYFNEKEIADIIMTIVLINSWNRIMVATRAVYKPQN